MIKAHFSWTWQCSTLNRGDELVNLLMCCLQPHEIYLPDFSKPDGQRSGQGRHFFGVLSLYHDTKTAKPGVRASLSIWLNILTELFQKSEPDYNFVLPHRDPLRCSLSALALQLHYMFDQENICDRADGWDWSRAASWRKVIIYWNSFTFIL